MRISDWSSDVCSSDLIAFRECLPGHALRLGRLVAELLQGDGRLGQRIGGDAGRAAAGDARAATLIGGHAFAQFEHAALGGLLADAGDADERRLAEHTSELQSLMRNSYAVFCLKQTTHHQTPTVEEPE